MGSKSPPPVPYIPPAPKREDLAAEDYAKKAAELRSLRESTMARNAQLRERGRQSLTNPGLGIPE